MPNIELSRAEYNYLNSHDFDMVYMSDLSPYKRQVVKRLFGRKLVRIMKDGEVRVLRAGQTAWFARYNQKDAK